MLCVVLCHFFALFGKCSEKISCFFISCCLCWLQVLGHQKFELLFSLDFAITSRLANDVQEVV